jgi:glycosyltransferase involved in cell wall biosynthesis
MKPLVSVNTVTYNQAPYIHRCIEGVLMQKTTFPFELVLGEDCSTDGTREIVMEYAQKYPDIIRVITSESNVGVTENVKRTTFACQGEFIAFCEGDDYWIDPLKLQKQYDAIIKYDATLVTHGTLVVFYKDGKIAYEPKIRKPKDGSGYLDFIDILSHRAIFHTSSIFMRTEIFGRLPEWFAQVPVGDYPIKVVSAYLGKVYYIDEIMSVYQKGISGSYTDRKRISKMEGAWYYDLEKAHSKMYANLDEYTGYQYSEVIRACLILRHVDYLDTRGNLDLLELSWIQKGALRGTAILTRLVPRSFRKRIIRKVLEFVEK